MNKLFCLLLIYASLSLDAQQPAATDSARRDTFVRRVPAPVGTITPTRETPAHDPVMIRQNDTYYLFITGNGLMMYTSKDMKNWRKENPIFSTTPQWVRTAIPNYRGNSIWAPDISYHNGKYYLYYSVSVFGKNTSCIGLVVNKTLDPSSADYKWEDQGKVIQSIPGRDLWNAIDANLVIDENKTPWLAFGSFWEGIKLVKLNTDLASIAQPEQWYTIARRPRSFSMTDSIGGNAAIEAPFIFRKGKYYYLFVSWDYCCRGEKSDYKVVVGRSEKIMGPYLDKNGVPLSGNGGSLVLEGDKQDWYGAGHNSIYTFDGKDYIIYHGYDAKDRGRSKLVIDEIKWDNGWPLISQQ